MDENKLSYRRIRNDVHIRLNNKEAATFLALMFYSDFNTGESHVIHKTLRDKTGEKVFERTGRKRIYHPQQLF